jgi:hypothetical protein
MEPGCGLIHPWTQPGEGGPKAAKLGDDVGGGRVGGGRVGGGRVGVVSGSGVVEGVGESDGESDAVGDGTTSAVGVGGRMVGGTPITIGVRAGGNVVIATGSG